MDRRTLFTVQAGLLLFLGTVILVGYFAQARSRRDRGAVWFSIGFLCAGVGLALQAYRGMIPPIFSIGFGNGVFMLFSAFAGRGIARTTGQKKDYFWLLILLNIATLLNYSYYTWWQPDVLWRTIEAVPIVGLMHLACIDLLLRSRDEVIRPAIRGMIGCFLLQIVPNVIRVTMAWKTHIPDAWFSWMGIITIAGLALSYMWISTLRMHAELERSAMTDPLTGLFNRRALDVLAAREIQRSVRQGLPCSALMMDVDRFKLINDSLGHAAGDASLCAVAEALQKSLRTSDIATRLGGDEFFVLLPDCDEEAAELVVSRLRKAIAALELKTMGDEVFHISVSMGQVTERKPEMTVEDLVHAADILLYREKQLRKIDDARTDPSNPLLARGSQGVRISNA